MADSSVMLNTSASSTPDTFSLPVQAPVCAFIETAAVKATATAIIIFLIMCEYNQSPAITKPRNQVMMKNKKEACISVSAGRKNLPGRTAS